MDVTNGLADITIGLADLKNIFCFLKKIRGRKLMIFGLKLNVGKSLYFSGSSGPFWTLKHLAMLKSTQRPTPLRRNAQKWAGTLGLTVLELKVLRVNTRVNVSRSISSPFFELQSHLIRIEAMNIKLKITSITTCLVTQSKSITTHFRPTSNAIILATA